MNDKVKFTILFYVGFTTYITIETLFRGYSYPLMGLDGAICFILFDKINEVLSWDMDLFLQGCIGSVLVTISELLIGLSLQYLHLPTMWDYSGMWLNFKGIICLPFSLLWIVLACIGIILADCINYYLICNGDRPVYRLFGMFHIDFPQRKCYH